jgi:hypothetical protein
MKKLIIFTLMLGLSGCAVVFQNYKEDANKDLSYGMSREEVSQTLGLSIKKSNVTLDGNVYEVWEYGIKDSTKVKHLGTNIYKVFFLDNKLVRWDKDKYFAQPSFEFHETLSPEQKALQN